MNEGQFLTLIDSIENAAVIIATSVLMAGAQVGKNPVNMTPTEAANIANKIAMEVA